MLGVLYRGTDYKILMGNITEHPMAPVSVESMVPYIQERLDKYNALYILSRCNGFLASSMCNGVYIVRAFNDGKFECDDSVRELILKGQTAEADRCKNQSRR